jgi:dolichyl-phosphate beta-glucosyltransferase
MPGDPLTPVQVCGIPFPDTQCGFKLFTRRSARVLFSSTHIKRRVLGRAALFILDSRLFRFAFDVEVLFLAVQANFKCADQEIEWTEVGGSTISSFTMFQMLKDILLMRCSYAFGFWTRQKALHGNKND